MFARYLGSRPLADLSDSLAYSEIRIALANLFRRFDLKLDGNMTPEDTERLDCFTTSLRGSGPMVYCSARRE